MIDSKPRCKAAIDIEKNRLIITMAGHVDEKSITKLCVDVRSCVAELKRGFEVINDLSQCSFMHLAGLTIYKKMIDHIILNRAGEMIRIIDDYNISSKQVKRLSEKINCYKPIYAKNYKESVENLESVFKRKSIRFSIHKLNFEYEVRKKIGKGILTDISTSGCAIESPTINLTSRSKPLITLNFDKHETLPSVFTLKSTVVRSSENMFAVKFTNLEDGLKEQLYKRFIYEVTRSVYVP